MSESPGDGGGGRKRGWLDPILSNETGLLSALEERRRGPGRGETGEWAHRRGEPRLLILCWAIYLLGASGATIMRLPQIGFTEPRFVQSAARLLVLLIAAGLIALWPMVRLSQASPRRATTAALVDYVALMAPLAAVLWPVTWLGRWDVAVTGALVALLAGWGLVASAIVAIGTRRQPSPARTGWAALMVGLILAAPALATLLPPIGIPTGGLLYASPLTAVHALTTEQIGSRPRMEPLEWWAGIGPACLGLVLWAGALVTGGGGPDRNANPSPPSV